MQYELITAAMRGSEPAYRDLYDLWYAKAYRVGKAVCGSRSLAEDAVQEALIRFWRALPRLKRPEAAECFFLKTVANEARRIRTKQKAAAACLPADGEEEFGAQESEEREQRAALNKAVGRLPEKLQSAVRLHYYGGFTESETAELLGVSLPSLKMRLVRARVKLKTLLEHDGYEVMGG